LDEDNPADKDNPIDEDNLPGEDFHPAFTAKGELLESEELTTPIELVQSKQGRNQMLIMNDYIYTLHDVYKSRKASWYCRMRSCPGRAMTNADYEQSMVGALRREHSHRPDPIQVKKCKTTDKITAKFYELECSGKEENIMKIEMIQFVKDLKASLPSEVQVALPKDQAIIARLFRRKKEQTQYFKRREGTKKKYIN
jgi:hypothetical protein